jgi:hypothetical protein
VEKRLNDVGELAVPYLGDNIPKLTARHKCQQIVPIFPWKLAEIVWSWEIAQFFFMLKIKDLN